MPRLLSLCVGCRHLSVRAGADPETSRPSGACTAFPAGIPLAIYEGGAPHLESIDGDDGHVFVPLGDFGRRVEKDWRAAQRPDPNQDGSAGLLGHPGGLSGVTAAVGDPPADGPNPADRETAADPTPPEQWHAVLAVENSPTGDKRIIEPGALSWVDLPFSMQWGEDGHDETCVLGWATRLEARPRVDGQTGRVVHAWGHYGPGEDCAMAAAMIEAGTRAGAPLGVSIVPDNVQAEYDTAEDPDFPGFIDIVMERWTAARIRTATVLDVPALAECFIEAIPLAAARPAITVAQAAILAAAVPAAPPAAWFDPPDLDRATPLTISDTGRIFGHLAAWGTCHTGLAGCTVAPHSATGYAWFLTGETETAEGDRVPVGQITMGTGHADRGAGPQAAAFHYDHTGAAVADVTVGEDDHGIWMAGALRPGLTAETVRALRAAAPSGDWRRIGGSMELVATLAVNVPGFPIPRTGTGMERGRQVALVAAGIVLPSAAGPVVLTAAANLLAERIGRDPATLVASLADRVHVG